MIITHQWLSDNARKNGIGWNRDQLNVVGVSWPPPKGWKDSIVGTDISEEKKAEFEALKGQSIHGKKIDKFNAGGYSESHPVIYTWPAKNRNENSLSYEWSFEKPDGWSL